jgi:hypothetical protein
MLCSIKNHWIQVSFFLKDTKLRFHRPHHKTETDPVSEGLFSSHLQFNIQLWTKSTYSMILRVKIVTGDENFVFLRLAVLLEYDEGE